MADLPFARATTVRPKSIPEKTQDLACDVLSSYGSWHNIRPQGKRRIRATDNSGDITSWRATDILANYLYGTTSEYRDEDV